MPSVGTFPRDLDTQAKGSFKNYVDKFLAYFDHLPPSVGIFQLMNFDKKSTFLDYLPLSSRKRSL